MGSFSARKLSNIGKSLLNAIEIGSSSKDFRFPSPTHASNTLKGTSLVELKEKYQTWDLMSPYLDGMQRRCKVRTCPLFWCQNHHPTMLVLWLPSMSSSIGALPCTMDSNVIYKVLVVKLYSKKGFLERMDWKQWKMCVDTYKEASPRVHPGEDRAKEKAT